MDLGIVCSPSAVKSKVLIAIPDTTTMFSCNTCTEFLGVFYYSTRVNPDNLPSKLTLQI